MLESQDACFDGVVGYAGTLLSGQTRWQVRTNAENIIPA